MASTSLHAPPMGAKRPLWSCSGCPTRWNGLRIAHCARCHATFSGPTAFDQHRYGGRCRPPDQSDLILTNGIWRHPDEWDDRDQPAG